MKWHVVTATDTCERCGRAPAQARIRQRAVCDPRVMWDVCHPCASEYEAEVRQGGNPLDFGPECDAEPRMRWVGPPF